MSEYQYYEFRAVDRPLAEAERRMLRSLSTRAEITSTSFVNTYDWGDFRGDPDALMEKCFDAFVYLANWGTRRFVLRLPKKALHRPAISAYCAGESLRERMAGDFVILEFNLEEGDGDCEEGEGWMGLLISLREDLLRGDLRCLYVGWLCCVQNEELDEDETEPPVPAGLKTLSESLQALVDFTGLDSALLEAAASESAPLEPSPARDGLAAWIRALPAKDKDDLLLVAALNPGSQPGGEILRRYNSSRKGRSAGKQPGRRTVAALLAAASRLAAGKLRRAAEIKAAERARQEQQAAQARARYLDELARKEPATWHTIETLIQTRQPKNYDQAVSLLIDLRDLATREKRTPAFEAALRKLRDSHLAKPSLLRRLLQAGL